MQTYSSRNPQIWKMKKCDDIFDEIAAKQEFVESWLRQLPDAPILPVDSESSIEILRQEVGKSANLEKRPSCSSIIDLINPCSQNCQKKFSVKKPKLPNAYNLTKKRPSLQAPALIKKQIIKSSTNAVDTRTADLVSTPIKESVTSISQNGEMAMDFHETEDSESSYTYTWVIASSTNSSTDNVESKQKDELKDSTPSIHVNKLKKKVLNSTVKNDARDIESVNFSRNLSPIKNCDVQYDALRQQQMEESTPYKSKESPLCKLTHPDYQHQKKLQKKAKKPLSSTAIYLSGTNIEERFQDISSIYHDDGTGKVAKQKQEINVPDSLVDTDAVNHSKEVKAAKCALTSTPVMETSKNHPAKLHIDLSSLGSASSCSDDIILLRKSDVEVNSEEIVAKSFDNEVDVPDLKEICIESPPAKPLVKNQDTADRIKTSRKLSAIKDNKTRKSKRKQKNKDIKFMSKSKKGSVVKIAEHPKITSKRDYKSSLISRKASITVCPLSLVPIRPMTKPTEIVYIQPANKEFWNMVKTCKIDPLSTVMHVKSKKKN